MKNTRRQRQGHGAPGRIQHAKYYSETNKKHKTDKVKNLRFCMCRIYEMWSKIGYSEQRERNVKEAQLFEGKRTEQKEPERDYG